MKNTFQYPKVRLKDNCNRIARFDGFVSIPEGAIEGKRPRQIQVRSIEFQYPKVRLKGLPTRVAIEWIRCFNTRRCD